jgi:two-component sensor histidine kinase
MAPELFLSSDAVQNIGFALHELATNASKHGALAAPVGASGQLGWP